MGIVSCSYPPSSDTWRMTSHTNNAAAKFEGPVSWVYGNRREQTASPVDVYCLSGDNAAKVPILQVLIYIT